MKLHSLLFRSSLLLFVIALMLAAPRASAQAQNQAQTDASVSQASALQTPAVPARITQAIDETQLVTLKGNVHPLARPEFDQGAVGDATLMKRMQFVLKRSDEQEAALQKLLDEQMSKDSSNFQKWLTPQQFGQMFGPADADIQTITMWLNSNGFSSIRVSPGRTYIEFSGSVGQVRSAFHTDIHKFLINGDQRQANISDPQIPAALTPVVLGIASLHNFPSRSNRVTHGIAQATLPDFTGSTQNFFAVGPADFAKIYNIPSTLDGTGGKIAIVGFSDINPADVDAFRTLFSLPPKNLNIVLDGGDPGFGTEEGEAALDVQASGAAAPKAQIDYILSEGTLTQDQLVLAAEYVIDNNSDDVMSLSFGNCEVNLGTTGNQQIATLWEEAAAQGITVVVSAGDGGPAGCDNFNTQATAAGGIAVSGIASTPFNVAVGGTDFDDVGTQVSGGFWSATNGAGRESAQGYIHEVPWNNSCAAAANSGNLATVCSTPNGIAAGSGGPSVVYSRPAFQSGIIPNGIVSSDAANHRYLPDISLFASDGPTSKSFYVVCQADAGGSCVPNGQGQISFFQVGGTSASAPSFAGVLSLIGQSESNAGRSRRLGNANVVLYSLAQTAAKSCNSSTEPVSPASTTCIFNDVTKGTNAVPCTGGASANCSAANNGVLISPASATTPAFTTAAGTGSIPSYDLATGLGSVNVANLANAWGTALASFHPTTTATKVNGGTAAINITHGTSVTLAATVTSGSGTPTGDVSWLAPTSVNGSVTAATLSGGSASVATTFLPGGGPYSLKAHYAGDGTFAASDDPTGVSVTVAQEASHLQYGIVTFDSLGNITSTNATSFPYGSGPILRFDILNSSGNACQPATGGTITGCAFDATGTVTITDNGNALDGGTFHLNAEGSVEDQFIQLTGGAHTLSATYSGDISYKPVTTAVTDAVTVTAATTATTVGASPTSGVTTSTSVTLTATIATASGGAGPTGTVTFSANGTSLGTTNVVPTAATSSVVAFGTATLAHTFSAANTYTISATYTTGDGNYSNSASSGAGNATITVTGSSTTPTITSLNPTSGPVGTSVTITGTNFGTAQGTSTVKFNGTAATQVTWGNTGTTITAVVPTGATTGNVVVTVGGTASNGVTFTVTTGGGTFTVSGAAVAIAAGSSGMSNITVTPSGGFTGTVNVTCPTASNSVPMNFVPGVTCSPNPLAINIVSASPVASNLTIAVAAPSSSLSASAAPLDRKVYAAALAATGGANGWWGLSACAGLAAIVLLLLPGRKRYRTALALASVCVLSVAMGCGGGYGGNGGPSPTTTKISVTSTKVASGTSISFTVNVTSTGTRTPTGSVQLYDGISTLGTSMALANGSATIPISSLSVGTHPISAHYLGDAYSNLSQSGALNMAITGSTTLGIIGTSGGTTVNGTASLTIN